MIMPLVSVLMPAYNHEEYVSSAVESALGQTHKNLELIVIDDASSDSTWEVLQSFQDRRLRRYRHDRNQGAHATLNEAMALAQGEYIAILDSDDKYDPCRLERLLSEVGHARGNDVFIFSNVDFIGPTGANAPNHPRVQSYEILYDHCETLGPASWFFAGNPAITTSNFFFSRSLANRVGDFFPLRYTHDWDWALRASLHETPIWVRENLLAYRIHGANTLSEGDFWRHIHENSYIQARALLSLGERLGESPEGKVRAEETLLALMSNESLHPVSLLCYLVYALSGMEAQCLLDLTGGSGHESSWRLQRIAEMVSYPPEIFYSMAHLAGQAKAVAAQAAMLDERWQAMERMKQEVADRDQCIASQTAMIEDRWNTIQQMSSEIASRDQWIADLNTLVKEKEHCIAAQGAMIEERWDIIQQMGGEIAHGDKRIEAMQAEIVKLNRNFFIRATKYLKRMLPKFGEFK